MGPQLKMFKNAECQDHHWLRHNLLFSRDSSAQRVSTFAGRFKWQSNWSGEKYEATGTTNIASTDVSLSFWHDAYCSRRVWTKQQKVFPHDATESARSSYGRLWCHRPWRSVVHPSEINSSQGQVGYCTVAFYLLSPEKAFSRFPCHLQSNYKCDHETTSWLRNVQDAWYTSWWIQKSPDRFT